MSNIGGMINKTVMGVITAVVFILVGIALGPTVTAAIADINATSMADVFLGTVIVTLSDFLPFFYYLGIVLGGLALIWAATRSY
jgi:membrane-anchored protein YejM (alkaline phosphatase superfamily)